ncbi:Lrp/AsnC family transcriptional regulator [Arthrobacter mangrovi]|uniref:AsnC family transcriptional regulator n=1 Tax=Arthrobacter mangrovi TaxID=2966350 RepID=A0ABQ5MYT6_9MICC|nr:Lrp/AsnC family transcriptional regulator [Arthrobacter mangrovi]GLB69113.1 AsnC family transcriptional regulator [Arthrobacter mangrovi]
MTDQTHEQGYLSERDIELANALQLAPRASWAELAEVLHAHPTTLSRRWARLVGQGLARMSIAPSSMLMRAIDVAFVELTCENQRVKEVADRLIPDERLMSIQFIAGAGHLLLTVAAAGHSLAGFLLGTLGEIPGVMHYSVRTVTSQVAEASSWNFRALPPAQARALAALHRKSTESAGGTVQLDQTTRTLLRLLSIDGRSSYRELAAGTGIAPLSAARRVNRLISGGYINVRCDVARRGSGRSISAILWGTMALPDIARINGTLFEKVAALRMMSTVTGANNIHIVVWLNNPMDLPAVEQQLLDAVPGLSIDDRRIVLRTFKYNGARLNEDGTFAEVIPMAY